MTMKKKAKKKVSLWDIKVNLVHDEKLDKLNPEDLAPKKLAEANKALRRMKGLPK